jgi:beta-RFAP synthase
MVRIETHSRLHFGLLSLSPHGTLWPDRAGVAALPARRFGGPGLMIERPGLRLFAEVAAEWSASGPLAERALAFARTFVDSLPSQRAASSYRLVVEDAPPEHSGLGTGTQLGLAVASCLALIENLRMPLAELARRVGRGKRSALGVYGFEYGGFMVESGQARPGDLGPLVARVSFPTSWRVVLVRPMGQTGLHGADERLAMSQLSMSPETTAVLCRLALLGMLPALLEEDIHAFGEALFDFNARAGEVFAPCQGGIYASAAIAETIRFIRARGVRGVGQSSWGPTVFAIVEHVEAAVELARALQSRLTPAVEILVTRAANQGACIDPPTGPA